MSTGRADAELDAESRREEGTGLQGQMALSRLRALFSLPVSPCLAARAE